MMPSLWHMKEVLFLGILASLPACRPALLKKGVYFLMSQENTYSFMNIKSFILTKGLLGLSRHYFLEWVHPQFYLREECVNIILS